MTTYVLAPPVAASSPSRPAQPGDRFAAPRYIVGASGSAVVPFRHAGREVLEQELDGGGRETVWLEWVAPAAGDLSLDATGAVIEVYQGDDIDGLGLVGAGTASVDLSVSAKGVYKVRMRPAATEASATLTWAFAERVQSVVVFADDVQQTPGAVKITVTNGTPGQRVTVSIDGQAGTARSVDLDSAGTVIDFMVTIDVALNAGAYTLRVVHPGRLDATDTFAVLASPDPAPSALPPATPATTVPGSLVLVNGRWVRRFVLQDKLAGGLGEYILPRSPTSMSSPFPDNVLATEATLASDGQIMTWEGARRSKGWTWSGYLDTEVQLTSMLAFQQLNRRFYVIDHRNRSWEVSMETFEPKPVKNVDVPWAHTYEATFLIHEGPVAL